jgi:hypothetical protein
MVGLSTLELVVSLGIILAISAIAIPSITTGLDDFEIVSIRSHTPQYSSELREFAVRAKR